ncbi:cupin domain-containing protein [Methylomonas sp. MO1]|uniref:cupin domain-containing protein n=1 Tax=Methylomonas sp. MO1 TaxID=3073619 RepID=UPI0028A41EB6|nr:cupin domain-containing protein [Methylomonas sp. MO1]MDT4289391.1 cupin domain-containing protein [Methylomonas sp. MO1]
MKVNLTDLVHRQLVSSLTGEEYSLHASISKLFGFNQVAIHHEIVPPGKRASSKHFHTQREELVLVLEGEVVAHLSSGSITLRKGDVLGFNPGAQSAHHVENHANTVAHLIVISSLPSNDEVIYV